MNFFRENWIPRLKRGVTILAICLTPLLTACGFHAQGDMNLAAPLKKMYLQTPDPYGSLAHNVQSYLKMSHVQLVSNPSQADTILDLEQDQTSEELLSVAGTQQTRQYKLVVSVTFSVSDNKGQTLLPSQLLSETRTITVQSNQVLGRSNEATLYTQQMRRMLANAILNRLSSLEVTRTINAAFKHHKP